MAVEAQAGGAAVPTLGTIVRQLGRLVVVGFGGGLAGGIVLGVLLRLGMRLVALATPPSAGLTAESGAIVGLITGSGTTFVLVGGAAAGPILGTVYIAIRRWLPTRTLARAAAFGLVTLLIAGPVVIRPDNPDFSKLGTPALDISVFALALIAAGMVVVPAVEWLDRRLPPTGPADATWSYLVVYVALVAACVAFVLLAPIVAAIPFLYRAYRQSGLVMDVPTSTMHRLIAGLVTLGLAWQLVRFASILTSG